LEYTSTSTKINIARIGRRKREILQENHRIDMRGGEGSIRKKEVLGDGGPIEKRKRLKGIMSFCKP
jgi:hypothetical protein